MPQFRDIDIDFLHPTALAILPEFPPPEATPTLSDPFATSDGPDSLSPPSKSLSLRQGNTVNVFIPTYAKTNVWIRYVITPSQPDLIYYFELFMNGEPVANWGCAEEHEYNGKFLFGLFDYEETDAEGNLFLERRALHFGPEEPAIALGLNERVIEIRVYRAGARRLVSRPPLHFQQTRLWKKGMGTMFDEELTFEEEKEDGVDKAVEGSIDDDMSDMEELKQGMEQPDPGQDCGVAKGLEEGLRLLPEGLLADPYPEGYYQYALLDPLDVPFATFRYLYRTWEQLHDMGIYSPSEVGSTLCPSSEQDDSSVEGPADEGDSFFNSPTEDALHPERFILFEPGRGLSVRQVNITPPSMKGLGKKPLPPIPASPNSPAEDDISPILGPFTKPIERNTSPTQLLRRPIRTSSLLPSVGYLPTPTNGSDASREIGNSNGASDSEPQNRFPEAKSTDLINSLSSGSTDYEEDFQGRPPVADSLYLCPDARYNLAPPLPNHRADSPRTRSKSRSSILKSNEKGAAASSGSFALVADESGETTSSTFMKDDGYERDTESPTPLPKGQRRKSNEIVSSIFIGDDEYTRDPDSPTPLPRGQRMKSDETTASSLIEGDEFMRDADSPTPLPKAQRVKSGVERRPSDSDIDGRVQTLASEIPAPVRPPPAPPTTVDDSTQMESIERPSAPTLPEDYTAQEVTATTQAATEFVLLQLPPGWVIGFTKKGHIIFQDVVREIDCPLVPPRTVIPATGKYPAGWEIEYKSDFSRVYLLNLASGRRLNGWPAEVGIDGFEDLVFDDLPDGWQAELSQEGRILFANRSEEVAMASYSKPGWRRRRTREASPPPPVPPIPIRYLRSKRGMITPPRQGITDPDRSNGDDGDSASRPDPTADMALISRLEPRGGLSADITTPPRSERRGSQIPDTSVSSFRTAIIDAPHQQSGRVSRASQRSDDDEISRPKSPVVDPIESNSTDTLGLDLSSLKTIPAPKKSESADTPSSNIPEPADIPCSNTSHSTATLDSKTTNSTEDSASVDGSTASDESLFRGTEKLKRSRSKSATKFKEILGMGTRKKRL